MKHFFAFMLACYVPLAGSAFSVHLQAFHETCLGSDGIVMAMPTGGTPPYTYSWSNGATTSEIAGLVAGIYTVTVTDSFGAQGTNTCNLQQLDGTISLGSLIGQTAFEPCMGQCNGGFRLHLPRLTNGYAITTVPDLDYTEASEDEPNNVDSYMTLVFTGACDGVDVELSVFNICVNGELTVDMDHAPEPLVGNLAITGSCSGADDGTLMGVIDVEPSASSWNHWYMLVEDGSGASIAPVPSNFNIGSSSFQVTGLHPGDWTLHFESQNDCFFNTPVTVPDLGPDCGTVSGTLHFETDIDCTLDGVEVGIPNRMLRVTPGPLYGVTASDGSYEIAVPYGSYDLEQLDPEAVQLCPPAGTIPFTVSTGTNAVVDLADSSSAPFNMHLFLWSGVSRVGMPFTYRVHLANDNGYVGQNVMVTLNYDPLFAVNSVEPAPDVSTPGQLQWNLPALLPFQGQIFEVVVQVPPDPQLLGNSYTANATATSTTPEAYTLDNNGARTNTIVGSYDPNDKQAFTSSQQNNAVYLQDVDTHIDYLIRFQNTGTDTAFNITVTDTISPLLDMGSLFLLGASHAFTPHIATGNVLEFHFANIMLPDSNVNELASHGYVAYRMRPVDGIAIGSTIDNEADIYFDFNDPVRTNTASIDVGITTAVVEVSSNELVLSPVPVSDLLRVTCSKGSIISLAIHSADGRLVSSEGGASTIDVSALAPGIYILRAMQADGRELGARFVKR